MSFKMCLMTITIILLLIINSLSIAASKSYINNISKVNHIESVKYSTKTLLINKNKAQKCIKKNVIKYSREFGLNPKIVHGIIMQESTGISTVYKYEKKYKWLYKPKDVKPKNCLLFDEKKYQKISWGLGQVMGAVYRKHGYRGWLPDILNNIDLQIYYTCKHLSFLKKKYPKGHDYLAAYNTGIPKKLSTGKYINQKYLNKVLAYANKQIYNKS